jgi:hypothetical protein
MVEPLGKTREELCVRFHPTSASNPMRITAPKRIAVCRTRICMEHHENRNEQRNYRNAIPLEFPNHRPEQMHNNNVKLAGL